MHINTGDCTAQFTLPILFTTLRPCSHAPVFSRPGNNRPGDSTTWSFKTSPVLTGRSNEQDAVTKQSCMHSDLQWIVIKLLLCTCCTVVVNVDVAGCISFIQKLKKKKERKKEDFGAFYTLFGKLRDEAVFFLLFPNVCFIFRRDASPFEGEASAS